MESRDVVRRYFEAWNAHDPGRLLALLAPGATYSDPASPGPISGDALRAHVEHLLAAFPDLRFEVGALCADGRTVAASWTARGTNRGPFEPGIAPTGRSIELPGAEFLEVEGDRIRSVRGVYDQRTLAEQLGLLDLVMPRHAGAATMGYSLRLNVSPARPKYLAVVNIVGRDESERDGIRSFSRRAVEDFQKIPGFIGIVTGFAEDRGFAFTAWESLEALEKGIYQGAHAQGITGFRSKDGVGSAVFTSVWTPHHLNTLWVRCAACSKPTDAVAPSGKCTCGAPLPAPPPYFG